MKFSISILRTAFAVAALSTGILAVNSSINANEECEFGNAQECVLSLALSMGTVSSTLFFISGATWKHGNN